MIEFGATLRAAREAKGYTVAQIAEITHMAPSTVDDLEKEDFSRIAAPIYGRGFVKLYCETVGLDPKPIVAEFMDIYNGNRDTTIKERPVQPPAQPPKAEPPPEEPPVEPPPVELPPPAPLPEPDLFSPPPPETDAFAAPERVAQERVAPEHAAPEHAAPEMESEVPRFSRYAAPVSQTKPTIATGFASPAFWRMAALACGAIVLLWLCFLGVRAIYRATNAPDGEEQPTNAPTAEEMQKDKAPKAAPPAVERTPQSVPALYID